MWFKNLQIYRLPAPWEMKLDDLESRLAKRPFQRCGSQDLATRGFVPPCKASSLVLASNQQWLVALGIEQKVLPALVVEQVTADRAEEVETKQGFKPGRKQMKEIREAVTQELLPRALTRRSKTYAWINPIDGWLIVDAVSSSKADEVLETLREVLDELPLHFLETSVAPSSAMADWLTVGEAPAGFTVDRDCELRSASEEHATVRFVHHSLEGEEIPNHLTEGKIPTKLGLTFDGRISFVLTDRLEAKRLEFLDVEGSGVEKDNAEEQFEADFVLMAAELSRFLPALATALGGEREGISTGQS